MLHDIEKYGVREEAYGKAWLHLACMRLKTSAARNSKRKKPLQLCLPEISTLKDSVPKDVLPSEGALVPEQMAEIREE
ncbi:MAG TPA: hypothetical protein DCP92_07390 [Nitrospiraceae bacterium]|jgi:hypothetical protein|nr:hypothetical protein [Nitrospiraceae bacterium]